MGEFKESLAGGHFSSRGGRKPEGILMTDNDQPFTLLWHFEVQRVEKFEADRVSQVAQGLQNLIEIFPVGVKHAPNVFKEKQSGTQAFHRCDKSGKSVA